MMAHKESETPEANIVRLSGGLGNQMFQFAFGQALAQKSSFPVKYEALSLSLAGALGGDTPRNYSLNSMKADVPLATLEEMYRFGLVSRSRFKQKFPRLVSGLHGLRSPGKVFHERGLSYQAHALDDWPVARYFLGYWQSPKYFTDYESKIREAFEPSSDMGSEALELLARIRETAGACLHVRRGDLVSNPKSRAFHGVMDQTYYTAALEKLRESGEFEHVFVFSDEPEWCKKNLKLKGVVEVVSSHTAGTGGSQHMHLMAACSGFVIPNSTFGWWGAWLSGVPGSLVVSPKSWFANSAIDTSDLIPKSWVRL